MKWFEYAIAIMACVFLASAMPLAYSIQGDCVVEENSFYRIEQCPHTIRDFTNYVNVSVTNKNAFAVNARFAFGFNTTKVKPTHAWLWGNKQHEVPVYAWVGESYVCSGAFNYTLNPNYFWCYDVNGSLVFEHSFKNGWIENKTAEWLVWKQTGTQTQYWMDWLNVDNAFEPRVFQGKTWYYSSNNVSFDAGETKTLRSLIQVTPGASGKYDLFAWLGEYTPEEAWNVPARSVLLDPWFDTDWELRKCLTVTETQGVSRTNEPLVVNVTGLTLNTNNCSQELRVIADYSTPTSLNFEVINGSAQAIGDENEWCQVFFLANVSETLVKNATHVAANSSSYCFYYNNSAATTPAFVVLRPWDKAFGGWYAPLAESIPHNWADWTTPHDGNLTPINYGDNRVQEVNDSTTTGNMGYKFSPAVFQDESTWEFRARMTLANTTSTAGICAGIQGTAAQTAFCIKNGQCGVVSLSDGVFDNNWACSSNEFHVYRVLFKQSTATYWVYADGALKITGSNASATTNNQYIFGTLDFAGTSGKASGEHDYLFIKKNGLFPPLTFVLGPQENTYEDAVLSYDYNTSIYEARPDTLFFNLSYNTSVYKAAGGQLYVNAVEVAPASVLTTTSYTNYSFIYTPDLVETNGVLYNQTFNYSFTYLNDTNYTTSISFQQNVSWSTYFTSLTANPGNALTGDLITISSNVTNNGNAVYTTIHSFNNTETSAPYYYGGLWISTTTAPTITIITQVNATAYLNVTYNAITYTRYATNYTTTIYPINLTVCGGGLPVIINYTTFNEDNSTPLLTSHYITITAWNNVRTVNATFNFTFAPTYGAEICIGVNASILIDTFHLFNATNNFGQRANFLYNYSASNASMQTIPLYLQTIPPSKSTKITVLDANGIALTYTDLTIQRYYPGNASYLSVAMIKTDNSGQGYTYLQPNDVYYYFSATKAGVFQGLFNSRQIICDSVLSLCTLTLQLDPSNNTFLNTIGKISASCTDNSATNVTSCTFIDSSGYYHDYTMTVTKQGIMANTLVCNTTIYTASGTMTCSVNTPGYYAVALTASGSPDGWLAGMNYNRGPIVTAFAAAGLNGANGAVIALIVVITVLLGAATAPANGLLFGVFALIFMGVIGLIAVSPATAAVLIIFAIMVAWKLKV